MSPNNESSFTNFLFHNRRNRILLYLVTAVVVVQFIIFKYLYPYANFLNGESFQCLADAANNAIIGMQPVGYARFLRFISVFTYSDTALVAVQYGLLQASGLFFLFTLFYFHKQAQWLQNILLVFIVINPLLLHLANGVSRDALFASLSIGWFSLLLWILHRPSIKVISWHTLVVLLAFTVRYQAIIYPFIALLAFGLSTIPLRKKLVGAGVPLLLCVLFMIYQGFQYKKITGHWQPVPMAGWLLANNAIYMYKHMYYSDQKPPVIAQFKTLDKTVCHYLNMNTNVMFYPWETNEAGNAYLWQPGSPLLQYTDTIFKHSNDTLASRQKKWAVLAPIYAAYGSYLIRHYPWQYLANYAAFGLKKYYVPPIEYLENYNAGQKEVPALVTNWFRYKNNKVTTRAGTNNLTSLNLYPYLNGIMNTIMLVGLLYYFVLKGGRYNYPFHKTMLLTAGVWSTNALFTIFLTTSALRLNVFPLVLTTTFALTLVDWMVQLMRRMKSAAGNQQPAMTGIQEQTLVR